MATKEELAQKLAKRQKRDVTLSAYAPTNEAIRILIEQFKELEQKVDDLEESEDFSVILNEMKHAINSLYALYEKLVPPGDILQAINAMSAKTDAVKDAIIAMADLALTEEQATSVKALLK